MSLTAEILQLSQQLKQERLFVNSERYQLVKLNDEVKNTAELLFHDLWRSKQQREILTQLTRANESVKPADCCSRVNQLDRVNFVDSYHHLSYHDIRVVELLRSLRDNPHLLAHCIAVCEDYDVEAACDLINISLSCIYGNCLMQEDETAVLHVLQTLVHLKLVDHHDPRRLIRKASLSFSVAFKQLYDVLFSARLFLTAAIHDPVMRLLMEDEWFYDIDPEKAVVRFPKAERIRRFGEIGTDEYETKLVNYRKFIVDKLVILTNHFIQSIKNNMHCFPSSLAWLISHIYNALVKRDTLSITEIRVLCTDLVFSLFICPAICDPEPHGITSDIPISHIARHNLMQIAQIIQILALYRSDEDIDVKLIDLYSRFDKGDMCSVLETILQGPVLQLPTPSPNTTQQDLCRSAMLLTNSQLTRLLSTLRMVASRISEDTEEWKQLNDIITGIPASLGQMPGSRHVTLAATPPGTPQGSIKRTTGTPVTPTLLRKSRSTRKKGALSPSNPDDNTEDGTNDDPNVLEDVLVLTVVPERQCAGMLSEHKVLSSEDNPPIVEVQEKRTRFSLSQDQESIGCDGGDLRLVGERHTKDTIDPDPDDMTSNNSDNQEAVSEAASSHSVGSVDMENDNDNFSDMLSANVSGRGTPSISGRDTPLSQAESDRVVRVTTPKSDNDDMGDMFGKFEIKAEFESEVKSTVSDTWSTDVIASDSEPPEQNHLERLEEVTEEFVRQHLLKGPDICETASDAWSTDVLASDTEDKQSEFTDVEHPDLEQDLSGVEGASGVSLRVNAWSEDRNRDFSDVGSGVELPTLHSVSSDSFMSEQNPEITPPFVDPDAHNLSLDSDSFSGLEMKRDFRKADSPLSEMGDRDKYKDLYGYGKKHKGKDIGDRFTSSNLSDFKDIKHHGVSKNRTGSLDKDNLSDFSDFNVDSKDDVQRDTSNSDLKGETINRDTNVPAVQVMGVGESLFKKYVPSENKSSDNKAGDIATSSSNTRVDVAGVTSVSSGGARPKVKVSRHSGKHSEHRGIKLDRGSDLLTESSTDAPGLVLNRRGDVLGDVSTDSTGLKLNRGRELLGETSTDEITFQSGSQSVENVNARPYSDVISRDVRFSSLSTGDVRANSYSGSGDNLRSGSIDERKSDKSRSNPPLVKDRLISSSRFGSDKKKRHARSSHDSARSSHDPSRSDSFTRSKSPPSKSSTPQRDIKNSDVKDCKDPLISDAPFKDPLTSGTPFQDPLTNLTADSTPQKKGVLGDLPQTDSGIAEMETSVDEVEPLPSGEALKLFEQQNTKLDSKRLSVTMNMYDPTPSENTDADVASQSVFTGQRPRNDSSGSSQSAASANQRDGSPSQSETSSLKSDKADDEGRVEKKKGIFNKMKERFHKGMMKKGAAKGDKYDDVFSPKPGKHEPNIVVTETSDDILDKYRKKVVLAAGDAASDTDSSTRKDRLPSKGDEFDLRQLVEKLECPEKTTGCETSDDILDKYRKKVVLAAGDAASDTDSSTRKDRLPSKGDEFDTTPFYDPNNLETCFAFHDAKRKLRLVLSTGDFNIGVGVVDYVSPRSALAAISDGKDNRDDNDLVKLLRTQLAEALNLQNKDLIAQLHEGIRCVRVFDNSACKKLLKSLRSEYKSRTAYISYLVRCRQGLLVSISHLERLQKRVLRDKEIVSKHFTNVCVRLFLDNRDRSVLKFMSDFQKLTVSDEKTDLVERFLQYLYQQMSSDPMWAASSEGQQTDARLAIERVIMSRVYTHAMFPNGDGDVYRDQILQQHIKKISTTITPQHKDLCIPRTYHHECPWPAAQREIYMINAYKTPADKLQCVVRSATTIMNLLSMASDKSIPAADDFVPVFIYVIIKANPPCLLSTIQYVNSFYENRLAGEEHYWWMQFISAVEFIKTMD